MTTQLYSSAPRVGRESDGTSVVVLLGAGASKDAELPIVSDLTPRLYESIISSSGLRARHVQELIQIIQQQVPEVSRNYELLFWIIWEDWQLRSLRLPPRVEIPRRLQDLLPWFYGRAATCMAEVLGGWPKGDASYLRHLAALAPHAPTKVFTLNFDTLVEEACSTAGIPVVTGFDDGGGWNPGLFEQSTEGVLLHKLHGSLSWFEHPRGALTGVVEARDLKPDPGLNATEKPAIVLGPVKTPEDSPPAWREIRNQLLNRYYDEIAKASVCVVIGFAWADEHIVGEIVRAHVRGMHIVEVSPTSSGCSVLGRGGHYIHVPFRAQIALETGLVAATVRSLRS